jgi:hypothetical protein
MTLPLGSLLQQWTWQSVEPGSLGTVVGQLNTKLKKLEQYLGQLQTETLRPVIDPRDFGGNFTGNANVSAQLSAAFNAAGGITTAGIATPGTVELPSLQSTKGPYYVNATVNTGIPIPLGVGFKGDGWGSLLRVDPASMTTPGANYSVFQPKGQNIINGIALDGNRANISGSIGAVGNIGWYCGTGINDVTFFQCMVSNLYNQPAGESFGFFGGGARITCLMCLTENNAGSGFSMNGNTWNPWESFDHAVLFCKSVGDAWNGITNFVTQRFLCIGNQCLNEGKNGINREWSDGALILGNWITGCTQAGINCFGADSNALVALNHLQGNNQGNFTWVGEFSLGPSTYNGQTGICRSAHLLNNIVRPTGNYHLSTGDGGFTPSTGFQSVCQNIVVEGDDIDTWNYGVNASPFASNRFPAGVNLRPTKAFAAVPIQLGTVSSYATQTNATLGTAPTGAIGANPTKITQTVANSPTKVATATTVIPAGRRNITHYRVCPLDANATDEVQITDGTTVLNRVMIPDSAADFGQWIEGDILSTNAVGATTKGIAVATTSTTASASSIGVDYITLAKLPYLGSLSEAST